MTADIYRFTFLYEIQILVAYLDLFFSVVEVMHRKNLNLLVANMASLKAIYTVSLKTIAWLPVPMLKRAVRLETEFSSALLKGDNPIGPYIRSLR